MYAMSLILDTVARLATNRVPGGMASINCQVGRVQNHPRVGIILTILFDVGRPMLMGYYPLDKATCTL